MSDFTERALLLRERGYKVIPIPAGQKRAVEKGWPHIDASEKDINKWGNGRYADGNIGILTEYTPAVDIDVTDEEVVVELSEWIEERFGTTCARVGRAPKRLLLFRCKKPFHKLFVSYNDGTRTHKLEILGAGQQFVAYGIHPDTHKPYKWISVDAPLDTDAADLPLLKASGAEEIVEKFCEICEERGWTQVQASREARVVDSKGGGLETWKPPVNVSEDTIDEVLATIPNDDNADYDLWLDVGMALHHQYDGSDEGLQKWHAWSEPNPLYSPYTTNYKWESFGEGPATKTFASLIYKANEITAEAAEKRFQKSIKKIIRCNDKRELTDKVLPEIAKACTTELQQEEAVGKIQERLKELTGVKPKLETVRKAFRAKMPKVEEEKAFPKWCEGFVFIERTGNMFNCDDGREMARTAFDSAYGRYLLSDEDRATGNAFVGRASDVALNIHEIPCVYDTVYLPGAERLLQVDGIKLVNKFNPNTVPREREPESEADEKAIKRVLGHIKLLFPDPKERRTLIDFLAYNVQFPDEKINWAVLVQGVDGGGKTAFRRLMNAVLGRKNIRGVEASSLRENFTDWAEGRKMVFIEEIRLHGQNRFEILDKLKPYITNDDATIRRHYQSGYEIINVTNYVMFTNWIDALPINNNDRRYFIIRTCFLTESHITSFNHENPMYFKRLFRSIKKHGPALRWWLLNHEISDDFDAKGHAPRTEARSLMIEAADASEETILLDKILRESDDVLLSTSILSSAKLKETDLGYLAPRALGALLAKAGFAPVVRCRLFGRNDENATYYTRHSELFKGSDKMAALRALYDRLTAE